MTQTDAAIDAGGGLRPLFQRLDLRLRHLVEAFRTELTERSRDPFRGLYISDADVDTLLGSAASSSLLPSAEVAGFTPRFVRLAELFGLSAFEQEAVLICLAPDVDLRYERLYGYLQDDVTRRRPTVGLVLRLLSASPLSEHPEARAGLSPGGRLMRLGVLSVAGEDTALTPLLARPLRVEERVVEYLLGSDRVDSRVSAWAELLGVDKTNTWLLPTQVVDSIVRLLGSADVAPVIYLQGGPGSAKRATARAACAAADRPLLIADVAELLTTERDRAIPMFAAMAREALLQSAVLAFDGFDALLEEEPIAVQARAALRRVLRELALPVMLLGESRWEPAVWLAGMTAVRVELPILRPSDRIRLWRGLLHGHVPTDGLDELATRYRLAEDTSIRAVVSDARSRALLRGGQTVDTEDLRLAARAVATPPLEGMAGRVETRYTWDDIVLPSDTHTQLREMCARLRHQQTVLEQWGYGRKHARRAGITALFAGQPGTGKTMAAEIVAGALGLELYRIDLSAVVSKYIGETEKNLEKIFRAADQGDAVLLFDEADAIFGKRSEVRDARDRYANVEVAYLLQRLEAYQGLAVLTTNLRGNIDEAFLRRLEYVLEFPLPEESERLAIWQRALPKEAPLGDDVDLGFLARKFKLAGGHIRNIALTAAFLAAEDDQPIGMRHLVRGTRREYQKLAKLVAETDFEHYYGLLKDQGPQP